MKYSTEDLLKFLSISNKKLKKLKRNTKNIQNERNNSKKKLKEIESLLSNTTFTPSTHYDDFSEEEYCKKIGALQLKDEILKILKN